MKTKTVKFEFSLTGFIIGLIFVSMFAATFAVVISEMKTEYNLTGNSTISNYNQTKSIIYETEKIRNSTEIKQDEGVLDVIGGYFRSGYSALKISSDSFGLFENMMEDASADVLGFSFFKPYFIAIFLIAIFIGIIIAVLVKMRI